MTKFSSYNDDGGCMHQCRHPLWGGGGVCLADFSADPAVHACSCDVGFAPRDAFGNASCVPMRALVSGYVVVSVVSMVAVVMLLWQVNAYRHLSAAARHSHKTVVRTRVLLSTSVFAVGNVFIGSILAVRAGREGYSFQDNGFAQALYIVMLPSILFGVAMMAEFWLESIPVQLVPPDSFTARLTAASRKYHFLVIVGVVNAGIISTLGILTLFTAFWPRLLADLAVGLGATVAIMVVVFVAIKITDVINNAMLKRSPSSRGFYVKAKKNLWRQALALCILGWAVIVVVAVRHLTQVGRGTPIIAWTAQVLCGVMSTILFTAFTDFNGPPPASPSARSSPNQISPIKPSSMPLAPQHSRTKHFSCTSGGSRSLVDVIHIKRLPTWRFSSRELGRGNSSNLVSHPHLHRKQQRETGQDQEEKGVAEEVGGDRDEENIVISRIEYDSAADESITRKHVAACARTSTARVLPTVGTIENDKDEVWETAVETFEDEIDKGR